MKLEQIKSKLDVLKFISKSSIFGNLGLFIGAGLPMAVLNREYTIALGWLDLLKACCDKFKIDFTAIEVAGKSNPEIATSICKLHAQQNELSYEDALLDFKIEIAKKTSYYPESDIRKEFAEYFVLINPKWIITTNYDTIIESLLTGKAVSLSPDNYLVSQSDLIPVYHLHGTRTNPSSIIITQEDYIGLFRPNQYRQQKLPLTIKESVTVLIGYNLGDFNVITAVDWSKNVYSDQNPSYPQDIIQFLYCKKPQRFPYRSHDDIVIVEFDDLGSLLSDLAVVTSKAVIKHKSLMTYFQNMNEELANCDLSIIKLFIDDEKYRNSIIEVLKNDGLYIIPGFMELFTRCIDETWDRSKPSGAFQAYEQNVSLALDILINLGVKNMPPALLEAVVSNLDSVAYYVNIGYGKSHAAYRTWKKRYRFIPKETFEEMKNIADARNYNRLKSLLKRCID